ncbi:hypothetical protein A3F00_00080 [Candidatus Daviesbacteria bacterium RIFCSPHIGHO2_12_FULL_37_11]|uniref:Uncharacterized protein n=1 Tax=Candidatus Daviesbacteria bacterium RIFCSPHIGHO2_12_FULL_37_11 TaxID=1797777 RepID=A0A1F5KA94_9BACT|nr:MAG: hypothetical protein A2111_00395 [Candidatus Daviesbacteria bacterium GWA1_38_6]OGE37877.1 MAG: hypothetical protein A3F00_00080 [Candidatus Daviesbacteria bacterium RIFCSPHIGHO2_12_FULL_37_11]OGE44906.1 MAG: hypothetical protein A3B39_02310 [Candidatus Daviesbacteria bacterium RIFCSPLOWO2_01_FULL_37_10]
MANTEGENFEKKVGYLKPSLEHQGGWTIQIPADLEPGEHFKITDEVDLSPFPEITPRVRDWLKTGNGTIGQFEGLLCVMDSDKLHLSNSPETDRVINLLEENSQPFLATPVSLSLEPVLYCTLFYKVVYGFDNISDYVIRSVESSKRLAEEVDKIMGWTEEKKDPKLIEWWRELIQRQALDARDLLLQMRR